MKKQESETTQNEYLALPLGLALAGLLIAGAATPLFSVDAYSACCDTSRSCSGGTLFECGSNANCVCDTGAGKCKSM